MTPCKVDKEVLYNYATEATKKYLILWTKKNSEKLKGIERGLIHIAEETDEIL